MSIKRKLAASIALITALSGVALVGPAASAQAAPAKYRLAIAPSDQVVKAGETFRLSGKLVRKGPRHGTPISDAPTRIQTFRGGKWVNLRGAHMRTNSEGRYKLRIILSLPGERHLRAVAKAPSGKRVRSAIVAMKVNGR